jgi:hypothetical protein
MSKITAIWNQNKAGITKAALNPASAVRAAKKIAPALLGETKAVSTALSAPSSGLSKVTANIDEVIPAMRQAKGRVVKPSVAGSGPTIHLSGTAAPVPMKTMFDHLSAAKGKWDGLSAGTRTGIKGTALVGGLGLSNAQGRSAGKETGMEIGAEKGYDAGFANASQQAAQSYMDPGVLGRLMEVFTGRQTTSVSGADPEMAARRQLALKRILAGG